MAGFGAGGYHYLNMLLTQMYTKTATLLVATMVLTSLLLSALSTTPLGAETKCVLLALGKTKKMERETSGRNGCQSGPVSPLLPWNTGVLSGCADSEK